MKLDSKIATYDYSNFAVAKAYLNKATTAENKVAAAVQKVANVAKAAFVAIAEAFANVGKFVANQVISLVNNIKEKVDAYKTNKIVTKQIETNSKAFEQIVHVRPKLNKTSSESLKNPKPLDKDFALIRNRDEALYLIKKGTKLNSEHGNLERMERRQTARTRVLNAQYLTEHPRPLPSRFEKLSFFLSRGYFGRSA